MTTSAFRMMTIAATWAAMLATTPIGSGAQTLTASMSGEILWVGGTWTADGVMVARELEATPGVDAVGTR
jgi:hypothetical protein